jgi:hypothetical protein
MESAFCARPSRGARMMRRSCPDSSATEQHEARQIVPLGAYRQPISSRRSRAATRWVHLMRELSIGGNIGLDAVLCFLSALGHAYEQVDDYDELTRGLMT